MCAIFLSYQIGVTYQKHIQQHNNQRESLFNVERSEEEKKNNLIKIGMSELIKKCLLISYNRFS